MRYTSSLNTQAGENIGVLAKFLTGATVTVEVREIISDALVTLTSGGPGTTGTASEISSTGVFKWLSDDIVTQPTSYTQYLVTFTDDRGQTASQKIIKGGFPDDISQSRFENAVFVDPTSGNSGTAYPNGTRLSPVDNMADALSIAVTQNINQFNVTGNISLHAADFSGYRFVGTDPLNDSITVTNATNLNGTTWILANLTGTVASGDLFCQNCIFTSLSGFSGVALQSTFLGTTTLKASVLLGTSILRDCFSALDNLLNSPIFDFNGLAVALQAQGFHGQIEVQNITNASALFEANLTAGKVIAGATNTDGDITVRGNGQIDDSSIGGTLVLDELEHALVLTSTEHYLSAPASSLMYTVRKQFESTYNEFTAAGGSTSTSILTDATEANDFWNDQVIVVRDSTGQVVARNVADYNNANGEFIPSSPFPFTPANGDSVFIISRNAASTAPTASEVADAVWDETLADHLTAGSTGEALSRAGSQIVCDIEMEVSDNEETIVMEVDSATLTGVVE